MSSNSSAATNDSLASSKAAQTGAPQASAICITESLRREARAGSSKRYRAGAEEGEEGEARVRELKRRVYSRSALSGYGLRDRAIIRAAEMFFYLLIGMICSSLRWEIYGAQHLDSILASGHRAIFTFWHSCIFSATWFWRKRGIVVMSSQSRDGEYTGRFIQRFGYGTARGSSTRGAGRAMSEMVECLNSRIDVAFTIDGPRGPAYVAKPGAVTLARHTGQAILPFHIAARRRLELSSWDRLQIPWPFTRAAVFVAEPIYVSKGANKEEVAQKQAALQASLDQLRSHADNWLDRQQKR